LLQTVFNSNKNKTQVQSNDIMPIIIPKNLPAHDILRGENIFVMECTRASQQDIRPIEILIVNLMPTKVVTETQLMRLLSNSPLQVNVTLLRMNCPSKNTSAEHLERFYKTFDDVKNRHFDGMIVTGAPVETLEFDQVHYWQELTQIMDYAKTNITSSIFICWGAQAALKYYYGVEKKELSKKRFGIYKTKTEVPSEPLLFGLNDYFFIPQSRHTTVIEKQIKAHPDLQILASDAHGASIVKANDRNNFFFFGHSEYDRQTLELEYLRDKQKGLKIDPPKNYFINSSQTQINMSWKSSAHIMFSNWLNYYVYQLTPYEHTISSGN
jgi:homoserine O-succinyltransferase